MSMKALKSMLPLWIFVGLLLTLSAQMRITPDGGAGGSGGGGGGYVSTIPTITSGFAANGSPSTITVVDVKNAIYSSLQVTMPAIAAGDAIVVVQNAIVLADAAPTDNHGNTYTHLGTKATAGSVSNSVWLAANVATGSTTITGHFSGVAGYGFVAWALRGVDAAPWNNDFETTGPANSATPTGSITGARPTGSIVLASNAEDGGATLTPTAGWNDIANGFTSGMNAVIGTFNYGGSGLYTAYKLSSATESITWTGGSAQDFAMTFVSLKPGTTAGPVITSIEGTASSFSLVVGTSPLTTGIVAFNGTFTRTPSCSATNTTTANAVQAVPTTTTVTLNGVWVTSDVIRVVCLS
jgi:hypothetical protein